MGKKKKKKKKKKKLRVETTFFFFFFSDGHTLLVQHTRVRPQRHRFSCIFWPTLNNDVDTTTPRSQAHAPITPRQLTSWPSSPSSPSRTRSRPSWPSSPSSPSRTRSRPSPC